MRLSAQFLTVTLGVCALAGRLAAQGASERVDLTSKQATAGKITGDAPHVDGRLDEAMWAGATWVSDFAQKEPKEGARPTVRTEVAFLFDDEALYIGARMHRPNPRTIRTSVTRRDAESDAEVLVISFDTFHDRRTAYSFSISSGGVRRDYYHPLDDEVRGVELQFDPVWVARTRVDSAGWTAEMRIPFTQLRFTSAGDQVWGLQIARKVPSPGEEMTWVMIPKAAAGFPSHFGTLRGVSGVKPSRRIELVPYVAGDLTFRANQSARNPFDDKVFGRAGADVKVGLGPNLTLDGTVNPDFGQVEADPAEVNLTAFETVFTERRPFFIEGSELLTGRGLSFLGRPTYFYSRRIGAVPHAGAAGDFVKIPNSTTIGSAAKVTGRLGSGLSIGALASVTPRERAQTFDTTSGLLASVPVEPATGYGVIRMQQEVGSQHSVLGATITGVHRAFGSGSLNSLLGRNAYTGGTDWRMRFQEGKYEFTGWVGFSHVDGDTAAMRRLQVNSAHYFQRPDQDHISLNPLRRSMNGFSASVRGDKNAGRFTVWGIQLSTRSPGFEINDLGQMRNADAIDFNGDMQIRDTKPQKYWRFIQVGTFGQAGWNYGGNRLLTLMSETATIQFHNYWNLQNRFQYTLRAQSQELTRGGPLMGTPSAWNYRVSLNNRANSRTSWRGQITYNNDELNGWRLDLVDSISIRPAPRWQVSMVNSLIRQIDPRQYVGTYPGGPAITYGGRYIFAYIDRTTISAKFRLNYAFNPNLTIEGYAEPFAASGRFYDFGELSAPGSRSLRTYGTAAGTTIVRQPNGNYTVTDGTSSFAIANQDFTRLSFRSNLVLRWEWLPGSTFFLIWQQNRLGSTPIGDRVRLGSLDDTLRAPGDNFVAVKVSYWMAVK